MAILGLGVRWLEWGVNGILSRVEGSKWVGEGRVFVEIGKRVVFWERCHLFLVLRWSEIEGPPCLFVWETFGLKKDFYYGMAPQFWFITTTSRLHNNISLWPLKLCNCENSTFSLLFFSFFFFFCQNDNRWSIINHNQNTPSKRLVSKKRTKQPQWWDLA